MDFQEYCQKMSHISRQIDDFKKARKYLIISRGFLAGRQLSILTSEASTEMYIIESKLSIDHEIRRLEEEKLSLFLKRDSITDHPTNQEEEI